jgi:hypothetical protein
MTVSVPQVNGVYYSYADIEVNIGPGPNIFLGLKSINYGHKLGRQYVRGTNREPLGQTSGQYEPTAEFELYRPQFNFLLTQLGPGYMQVSIPAINISYGTDPESLPLGVVTDTIQNARIIDVEENPTDGLDAVVVKVTLMPQRILFNGIAAVTVPLPGNPFVVG